MREGALLRPRVYNPGMDGTRKSRRIVGPSQAIWLLSLLLSCGTSVAAVYVAFDRRSVSLFLTSDGLDIGVGLGLILAPIVGTSAFVAAKRFAPRVAIAVAAGIGLPILVVWLWYSAWAATSD